MTCGWLISCRKRCLGTSKPDVWCTSVLERGHLQHSKVVEIKFHLNVGNIFYLFSCACHAVLKGQMHVKSMVVPSIRKSANFILQGEPSESFQHLQWHPISTQLKAWWVFSLQTSFQGVWLWYISRILLERGGNLYQKKFFCLFQDPKTRRKQKLWSSRITRDF